MESNGKEMTQTIYSGSAPMNGNDLHPLSATIDVESQCRDQRTRVLEFHKPEENYNFLVDNHTYALAMSIQKKGSKVPPLSPLIHIYRLKGVTWANGP